LGSVQRYSANSSTHSVSSRSKFNPSPELHIAYCSMDGSTDSVECLNAILRILLHFCPLRNIARQSLRTSGACFLRREQYPFVVHLQLLRAGHQRGT
ncbi:hypothetical protein PFISCL1PPCAC_13309, partial [Pristionchus fissidentatus]